MLPDHAENGLRGPLAAFLAHVDIGSRRSLQPETAFGLDAEGTRIAAPEAAEQVIHAAGTADRITFVPSAIDLPAPAAQAGLARLGQTRHVVHDLVQVLGELRGHQ